MHMDGVLGAVEVLQKHERSKCCTQCIENLSNWHEYSNSDMAISTWPYQHGGRKMGFHCVTNSF